jgi:ATP-binding cassette subfamily F protein 3
MPSKDVLKEAIKAFDGTAIIVSHDREFLDGLVTKVFEFGGGKVREHIGGIYDYLQTKRLSEVDALAGHAAPSASSASSVHSHSATSTVSGQAQKTAPLAVAGEPPPTVPATAVSYAERKELQKHQKRAEKAVEESEKKIARMEQRLKELDALLCDPKNASDMTLVTEYTDIKRQLDSEVERWEKLSEEVEAVKLKN